MAEQILEGVNPTRMELLEIRKKITLAEKGHKLLEEKRDALVERFFGLIDKRNELAATTDAQFERVFTALIEAEMILGEHRVEDLSYLTETLPEVTFEYDNIMGVKIPKMTSEDISSTPSVPYSLSGTCSRFDDAYQALRSLVPKLLTLADLEGGIKSLAVEIEKTKRRVNVLENTLIPRLYATRKYIEMQLEEREREDFFRRKRIKAVMEARKG